MASAALAAPAAAQTPLAGTWQGRLDVAPDQNIAIQFIITAAPGGGYSATVTSPDSGAIKNVRAGRVAFTDNRLAIDVPELSGSYAGTLREGLFEGEWKQEGKAFPLTLRSLQPPTSAGPRIDVLKGQWSGLFKAMGIEAMIVLDFSPSPDGAMRAVLNIPSQGVKDWETRSVTLDNGHFSVEIPAAAARISGMLEGDQIVGHWNQMGNSVPLTMKKGRYVAPAHYLDLSAAAREQLAGRWSGTLGPLTVVVRFESDSKGRTRGFFDSPNQNLPNIPITEAGLSGAKLTFGIAGFGGKYSGDLAGDKVTGEWIQAGMTNAVPLVLTRDPPATPR
jgi:hypothetical protein